MASYGDRYRRRKRRRGRSARRRQQVQRQLFAMGMLLILIVVCMAYCAKRRDERIEAKQREAQAEETKSTKAADDEEENQEEEEQEETAEERLARVKKQAEEAGYPAEIIELLSKNPETVDFVEHYGEKKDAPVAETVGEVQKGQVPQLVQWDERWGYAAYGTSTVAASGCGPTCMSMVIAGITGDASVTPAKIAQYGMENGFINEENDTFWQLMQEAGQNWGVSCQEIILTENAVAAELAAGHPIVCAVGPGDFTRNGHFIVLAAYSDGNLTVYDPFSIANSARTWTYEQIAGQTNAMWSYY